MWDSARELQEETVNRRREEKEQRKLSIAQLDDYDSNESDQQSSRTNFSKSTASTLISERRGLASSLKRHHFQAGAQQRADGRVQDGVNAKSAHLAQTGGGSKGPLARYNFLSIIGSGAFGKVFKARDLQTGEMVAIKQVLEDENTMNREVAVLEQVAGHCNSLINLKRCFYSRQPAYCQGQLQHHVSKYKKPEQSKEEKEKESLKYLNLVCDLMPMTLSKFLTDRPEDSSAKDQFSGQSLKRIKRLCLNLFEGLACLHERGIAHRDIKPDNILVDPHTGAVKVCDFGSAKQLGGHNYGFKQNSDGDWEMPESGSKSQAGSVTYISTRYYRAPELLYGNPYYGIEVDLWAAGCVLAEIFSVQHDDDIQQVKRRMAAKKSNVNYHFVLFRGQNNTSQLSLIQQAKGLPSKEQLQMIFPLLKPPGEKVNPTDTTGRSLVDNMSVHSPPEVRSLIRGLLEYDPKKRITAKAACKHYFFQDVEPLPLTPFVPVQSKSAEVERSTPLSPLLGKRPRHSETDSKLEDGQSPPIRPQGSSSTAGHTPRELTPRDTPPKSANANIGSPNVREHQRQKRLKAQELAMKKGLLELEEEDSKDNHDMAKRLERLGSKLIRAEPKQHQYKTIQPKILQKLDPPGNKQLQQQNSQQTKQLEPESHNSTPPCIKEPDGPPRKLTKMELVRQRQREVFAKAAAVQLAQKQNEPAKQSIGMASTHPTWNFTGPSEEDKERKKKKKKDKKKHRHKRPKEDKRIMSTHPTWDFKGTSTNGGYD